ncbi:MAG: DUF1080 domain-containing protein, partial [Thermoguttaceae bacterium]|nr:DUF1080 domain-containing protein [Thermoguttaceae bacterium]
SDKSTPLLSGFTFGDVELRFRWSASEGGAWRIGLPDVPSGEGLALVLREGNGAGAVHEGSRVLAPGTKLAPAGKPHEAVVRRTGDQLTVEVDGQRLSHVRVRADRRFGLGLALASGEGMLADLRAAEPDGESIFSGTNLEGWWTPGNLGAWGVEDGCLVLRGMGGNYLRTKKQYGNFTLSLEYKIRKGGNSGIGIRTPAAGWPSGDGMELQFMDIPLDRPLDKHAQMAIYGNVPPLARADRSGQWNRVVIKADGWMVSGWVNGELVQHCNTRHHPELKHRHLSGWIGIQDHGARIELRNVRVLEAPAGEGLAQWRSARPSATATLLDRLMNPERLSRPDGIRSASVAVGVQGESRGAQVLADLAGPGAVVRIARSNDEGKLAFYFDGEEKPRLECAPGGLAQALPHVAEDANPVLTCLAYRKSLRIVLRGARHGEYQIGYVTFPPGLPVETYAPPEAGVPRGWLSAVAYRREQFGWGVHREHDPLPRAQATAKVLAPGQRETLIRLDGSGVVHWVKLTGDKRVLDRTDLWLEATVGGEPSPSISTPVRFWFPGLAGQGNYQNFVLVDRGGVTNTLAIPFDNGLSLSLVNRGTKPIRGAGLAVSFERSAAAPGVEPASRLRLRAVFQPADHRGGDVPARAEGPGRWVGLVCEHRSKSAAGPGALVLDGKPVAGWTFGSFDRLFGPSGDFRSCDAGRRGALAWRYFLLDAVDFERSFALQSDTAFSGDRLVIFYQP